MARKIVFLCVLGLAGCAGSSTDKPPLAPLTFTAEADMAAISGTTEMTVRTFVRPDPNKSGRLEISGAACHLESRDFHADLITPARIFLPALSGSAQTITVSCSHDAGTGRTTQVPINDTLRRLEGGRGALIGPVVRLASRAVRDVLKTRRDPGEDQFVYPEKTDVLLGPETKPR